MVENLSTIREGLQPKPKRQPAMKKTRYAQVPPHRKTEKEHLRLRILELGTENAYLKKVSNSDIRIMTIAELPSN